MNEIRHKLRELFEQGVSFSDAVKQVGEQPRRFRQITQERIALQVLQRGLQVARAEYALWDA